MGDLAQQKAGTPLSGGGRSLQSQLDVSNQGLQDTRQQLLQQYAGLGNYRDQTIADTNTAANQAQQDFTNHQANLKNYLTNQASADQSGFSNAQNDARNSYAKDQQGTSSVPLWFDGLNSTNDELNQQISPTWGMLQGDLRNVPAPAASDLDKYSTTGTERSHYQTQQALNQWQNSEDQQYAGAGRPQATEWNTIQDILNSSAPRQAQDFKVRG
jgi:monoamine oxidase